MKQETLLVKNRNDLKMSVRITIPEKQTGLAFLEHGFTGNKNENHMLILEEEFTKRGYVVVNLDATDSLNESESSSGGITFTGHYNDLTDTIEWAHRQEWYKEPFALAGHSMGADAVLLYAESYPARVNLLVLVSFAWLHGKGHALQNTSKIDLAEWKRKGYYNRAHVCGKILRVPYSFREDVEQYDFAKNAGKVTARTIIIIGDQENPMRLDDNRELLRMLSKCRREFILLPNTPHVVAETPENAKTFREALRTVFP